jgi:hypothetical protein
MTPNQQTKTTHSSPSIIDVAYSFSSDTVTVGSINPSHVFLDILFMHPRTSEVVNMRTVVSANLLCQPKDQVEAAVHREIRNALSFQGTSHMMTEEFEVPLWSGETLYA